MNYPTGVVPHLVVKVEMLCYLQHVHGEPTRTINIKANNYITVIKGYV
jgi:hypothetical protein